MAKASPGTRPVENSPNQPGAAKAEGKSTYSQGFHTLSTNREVPRSLPFSEDGENGVLCSLLLSPREIADICMLRLRSDAFYVPAHQIIYDLVIEFRDTNKPVDFVSLRQALKDRNRLEETGGVEY